MLRYRVPLWSRKLATTNEKGEAAVFLFRDSIGQNGATAFDTNLQEGGRIFAGLAMAVDRVVVQAVDLPSGRGPRDLGASWVFINTRIDITGGPITPDGIAIVDYPTDSSRVLIPANTTFGVEVRLSGDPSTRYAVSARIEGELRSPSRSSNWGG